MGICGSKEAKREAEPDTKKSVDKPTKGNDTNSITGRKYFLFIVSAKINAEGGKRIVETNAVTPGKPEDHFTIGKELGR